ncbi:MAG: PQQ-binding-like beta-propeller repeat protein [Candidatus Latescibacteria bacterium]|nr:PQQ-binding-like beta-propeller repeat protein [Candidatus Latescibacterota bacterium]
MPTAPTIQGQVRSNDSRPLSGVAVSNGHQVACTDAQGHYTLPRTSGQRFVFICAPAGYRPLDRFYQPLGDANFVLAPHPPGNGDSFVLAQITDMHISVTRRAFGHHLREDLTRIVATAQPDFFIASGDLTGGGTPDEYRAYLDAIAPFTPPFFHAAGNHDDDQEVAGHNFQDHLGPLYYSFDWGPVHFIVYDGESDQRGGPDYQRPWLQADLSLQPADKPVVVVNHFPRGASFYQQWSAANLVATLSGHWHSTRMYRDGDTTHYNTPTLGFGGIDQSPRGYRLLTWKEGQLHSEFHTLAGSDLFPGITFRPPADTRPGHTILDAALPQPQHTWPQFHGGPLRTGHQPNGPRPPLTPAWRTDSGGAIHLASPTVAEGLLLQPIKNEDALAGNALLALDASNGRQQWRHPLEAAPKHAAAYSQGRVFIATVTGQIIALATDGSLQWTYQLGDASQRWLYSSPLVTEDRLYAGVSSHLAALDPASGQLIWNRTDLGVSDWLPSYPSPAAWGPYLAVAFYAQSTNLAVLEAATGETIWAQQCGKSFHIYSTPVIDPEGNNLYAVSGGNVRAFNLATGEIRWESPLPLQRIQATPALAHGRLFAATGSGALHALDTTTGAPLWQWDAGEGPPLFTPYLREGKPTLTSPVIADQILYIGSSNGTLHALDLDGHPLWQHNLSSPLAAAPALSEGALWVGTCYGTVHAFGEKQP